jgi:hypothetical protein
MAERGVPMARVPRRLGRAAATGFVLAPVAGLAAIGPAAAARVAAAHSPSACAPAPPYRYCQRYSFTGNDQWFTVPGGVTRIEVLEWGAGGGGASLGRPQYSAGAGGFTVGQVAVRPGKEFTVSVGQGGTAAGTGEQDIYGGGGFGGNGAYTGGSGGGMSALWANGYAITPVLIAGAGGGVSPGSQTGTSSGRYPAAIGGGGGGGLNGGTDGSRYSGQGGSQFSAGDPGSPGADCGESGLGGTAPAPGQPYYGGNGGGSDPGPAAEDAVGHGGGGGGGGYYGGGGGRCQVDASGFPGGDGGGGSGYIARAGVTHAFTRQGTDGNHARTGAGVPPAAAAVRSRLYQAGIGRGGGMSGAGDGGNGQIVIEWGYRAPPRHRSAPAGHRHGHHPSSPRAGSAQAQALPLTGFQFAQVGVVAVVLIGLGVLVAWVGTRQRPR